MKRLLKVPLLGRGTKDIESLPSYLCRLSVENHINTFDKFLRSLSYSFMKGGGHKRNYVSTWLTYNSFNQDVFERIRKFDSSIVDVASFISLTFLPNVASSHVCDFFKWCPYCISEMKRQEGAFFKLSWSLREVTHCDIHHFPLQDYCISCGARQYLNNNIGNLVSGNCSSCGKCLSRALRHPPSKEEAFKSNDIIELVSKVAIGEWREFSSSNLMSSLKYLQSMCESYYGDSRETILIFDLLNPAIEYEKFKLQTLRELSLIFQVPLVSLLNAKWQG